MEAILNSPIVEIGKFDWTITDVIDGREEHTPFVFGKLSKYAKEGEVLVVDEASKSQVSASAHNLLQASSPFVYLPEYSGMAFLHVWNGIQEKLFPRRFKAIIEAAYDNFFVGCEIEPVADYRAFSAKLKSIDHFTEISAKVYPPNPLFGRLWESLHEYIKKRHASDVLIKETSSKPEGLETAIGSLVEKLIENNQYEPDKPPDIADAALLMAADGYGTGKIIGLEGNAEVVIRTSDSQRSFLFTKDPIPSDLVRITTIQFSSVSEERDMRH
ncbi:hypothetical protein [Herbaspirillum rubrisubalbicans]|uniref:hypothetical protein n=1 Tax=Herbaspirillum rubrisubalbicans TaxID=80842 RepID=UPI0011BD52AD|nr:hypothetical protein [Herbaspirillum rubrisubalbicans]